MIRRKQMGNVRQRIRALEQRQGASRVVYIVYGSDPVPDGASDDDVILRVQYGPDNEDAELCR